MSDRAAARDRAVGEPRGSRRRWRPFRHVTFTAGFAVTAALLLVAAVSLVYTPRDPLEMSITGRLQGPSPAHPLGTDQFGRDLLSRVMTGAVTSILVGVIAAAWGRGKPAEPAAIPEPATP